MLGVFIETGVSIWVGHGHISLDVLVATYYSQATTQLKIIRNNLENLCGVQSQIFNHVQTSKQSDVRIGVNKQYIDDLDENTHKRFVRCVQRYEKVVWFVFTDSSYVNIRLVSV